MAGAAAAAATGGTAGVSQATRSVHTGTRDSQEGGALGLGVVQAPPLDGVFLVHELYHRFQVVAGMVSSLLSPRRSLAAAAATSAWASSGAAALSASAASFSAFARMAVCAAGGALVAPQTTNR